MFVRTTEGKIVNLDQYGTVKMVKVSREDWGYNTFAASILIDVHTSTEEGWYPIHLWHGTEDEANDKMAELWAAIQDSEWAFDFGENGTPIPEDEPAAQQSADEGFNF